MADTQLPLFDPETNAPWHRLHPDQFGGRDIQVKRDWPTWTVRQGPRNRFTGLYRRKTAVGMAERMAKGQQ